MQYYASKNLPSSYIIGWIVPYLNCRKFLTRIERFTGGGRTVFSSYSESFKRNSNSVLKKFWFIKVLSDILLCIYYVYTYIRVTCRFVSYLLTLQFSFLFTILDEYNLYFSQNVLFKWVHFSTPKKIWINFYPWKYLESWCNKWYKNTFQYYSLRILYNNSTTTGKYIFTSLEHHSPYLVFSYAAHMLLFIYFLF